jgi:hypothetical protein
MKSPAEVADLVSDTLDTIPNTPTKESILVAKVLIELMKRLHKETPTEWIYFNGKFEAAEEYLEYYAGVTDRGERTLDGCLEAAKSYWHGVTRNINDVVDPK